MPIPEFILATRRKIGHDLLWLPGVTAVVFDDVSRVLLGRRSDDGRWTTIGGIPEPGEQPAVCAVREVLEETGVTATVERLVSVRAGEPMSYPNGDRAQFLDLTFRCRYVSGEAHVADDESLEVGWFGPAELPDLDDVCHRRIEEARTTDGPPSFVV
ncbi:MAG TPA: NUDIX domain-containing protein [Jiangellaceae bacterium]